ncbi:preprotein translocase subunit YajC [Streptomyces physcomitrii]|uniref:Preprotein translocase subunit YajC n=1 Tax=Streptomyces physcomitrii TaxID=2724184 RepID=A0ABX1H9V3_9ACTN|nr:preprotein translocase subunit YajC [Streptomyces physcomitrii]NKI44009.1 preprotein translocase subunit YajC [Streptomyces physcomitrii]
MSPLTLLPFVVLIGAMFLMTRSAKKKQQQAVQMREQVQPGTGIRTIGGMYATVKEVNEDTLLLEVAPGVHAVYAKNSVGAVLDDEEYNRIVHGTEVPDDASSLTDADATAPEKTADSEDDGRIDLAKDDEPAEAGTEDASPKKTDGESDAK